MLPKVLPVYIEVKRWLSDSCVFEGVVDASGNWVVENIDVSSLRLGLSEWTVDAKVFNTVGNRSYR